MCWFSPPPAAVPSWKPFAVVACEVLLPHLLGPGHPYSERPGGSLDAFLEEGWDGGSRGCCGAGVLACTSGKDLERGASSFAHLLVLGRWACFASPHLWDAISLQHSLCAASRPKPPLPAPAVVPVSHESQVGAEHGRGGWPKPPTQTSARAGPGHAAAFCLLLQLPGRLFMNQVLAWLAGGSFLMSKTFKISLKTFKIGSSVQRDPAGLENSDWFNGFFF